LLRYFCMMNKSKNVLALTLMISSIALLLMLQLFWLRNSYERAFFGLRRESNFIFRNTLYSMRDSLYQGNIRVAGADTLNKINARDIKSINVIKGRPLDSSAFVAKSSTVQIFVTDPAGNKDSIIDAIRPMTQQLRQVIEKGQKSFFVRLAPDTVSLDTLKLYMSSALKKANIPVGFVIIHQTNSPEWFHTFRNRGENIEPNDDGNHVYSDTIQLESLRFNPGSRYTASIFPIRSVILKQIAPQILFSLLLTLITIIAFIILYRNLLGQQRLMELKNDFISNVTHELKTPVATVSVALEALKNFHALNDPKLTKEYLDIAQNELNRLTLMTDKILKASVFESKGITVNKESVDLKKVITQILDSMRLIFEKRQARVTLNTKGENFSIAGEHAHITNVIYNLLDNALKYSPNQPVIDINLRETSDEVILSVKDEGLGIAGEYRKKIFEKFFRVPTGDIHNIKGYGLGLSYVAGVVKAHAGSIDVQSESGKGSTFIIHWPKHSA
jgi:two-component system, OmpR family, phosphate regulon sensor histidine kinase PhoR